MSVEAGSAGFRTIGQQAARDAVARAAAAGRLQRTLLVHGPAGAGKGSFVEDLLALLFCTAPDAGLRPCNDCRGCRTARERTHPDLVIGSVDRWREQRSTGESIVSVARRWLLEGAGAPVASERRVVLIEGIDRAGEQIQNALLKVLEEPAPRQMFVLVADEPSHLLPTIRSRAQGLRIGPVPNAELVTWLMDVHRLPRDQAAAIASIADGMAGRAAGFVATPGLLDWRRRTQAELLTLLGRGRADRFSSARELLDEAGRLASVAPRETDEPASAAADAGAVLPSAQQRAAALLIVDAWIGLTRDLLLTASGRPQLAPAIELVDGAAAAATRVADKGLLSFLQLLERIRDGLRQNAAPRLALERAMLAWPAVGGTS
jgi:DNA polymerase III delta prime subunit